jgi:predicted RNase H-like HicB family nuclease
MRLIPSSHCFDDKGRHAKMLRDRPEPQKFFGCMKIMDPANRGRKPGGRPARSIGLDQRGLEGVIMAFGYRYTLERQENGWWLVRFPGIPEALTEGETEEKARANARDCVITAIEGYMKAGKPLPRERARHAGSDRVRTCGSSTTHWRK